MKIAVIGGGFTGLSAAYTLTKSGHQVAVFEKDSHFGGLAWGYRKSGWEWPLETFYHHIFYGDRDILELVAELGLSGQIIKRRPLTVTQSGDAYFPLDSPASLLSFPGLPLSDKIRTGLLLGILKLNPFWQPLESYSARDLFPALGGQTAWKVIWDPLLSGKFGNYAPEISAAWFWARIKKRTSALIYFSGGFQKIIDALTLAISQNHGRLFLNTEINKIQAFDGKISLSINGKTQQFDKILFTGPTSILAKLAPFMPEGYLHPLLEIPHLSAQILVIESPQPILKEAYWLNITDRSYPFLALVQHTNFIDKKFYGGKHIAYIGNYFPDTHPFLKKTATKLFELFLPYLKKINRSFNYETHTTNYELFTATNAQPVHLRHYSRIAPRFITPIPNLYLANMDSIFPWDRGTNYAVKLGRDAAFCVIKK
jgi:protoporphyrinogen oxidase